MRPSQARFVTACQQLLALAAVLAVLAPAAGVLSLDLSGPEPSGSVTERGDTTSRHVPGGSERAPGAASARR